MSESERRDLTEANSQNASRLGIAAENLRMALILASREHRNFQKTSEIPTQTPIRPPIYVDQVTELDGILGELRELVVRANESFNDSPYFTSNRDLDPGAWSLGNLHRYSGSISVLRGSLDVYFCEAIVPEISPNAALFFTTVPGIKDLLKRETHSHFGWHYHYCKPNRDRSDTILSFDANSPLPAKPLLWEYHSEHKAKFKARPNAWSMGKRENIYNSCKADILVRPASEFRRPAKDAVLTWPLNQ